MPRVEVEIDRLYQLPLAEFTAARNALAKRLGKSGAAVKALQKPSVAAWAVNQLYWRQRPRYDKLVKAAARRSAAHAKRLSGKGGDLTVADTAHQDALRAATTAVLGILRESGDVASSATLAAVTDTLRSLPGPDAPGRLTKPLKPMGLEALSGLVAQAPSSLRLAARAGRAASRSVPTRDDAKGIAAAERRAEKAREREIAVLDKEIREARRAERQADTALRATRKVLDRTQQNHERLQDQLQFVLKQIQDGRDEIARQEVRRREATNARERLEARLDALQD